jgi:integrase/recombinase XerC
MPDYASRTKRPPRTLTDAEQARLLKVSGEHRAGFRDHVIFSLALGCALRISELVALDVSDVTKDGRKPKWTIDLRVFKRAGADVDPKDQRVHLAESTYYKLEKYLATRPDRFQDTFLASPLFVSREGNRLHERSLRDAFYVWQERAGFDRRYNFHILRHTAITNVRRETKDIRLAQRVARHRKLQTTTIYDHPSDEEVAAAVRGLAV